MSSQKTDNSKFNMTDIDLLQKIDSLGYKIERVIYQNERKQRYALLVTYGDGEQGVLKWNSTSNAVHFNKINKEVEFLKRNQNFYLPDLIYSESNLLLLKYLDGSTLREWITDYRNNMQKSKEDVVSHEFITVVEGITGYVDSYYFKGEKRACEVDLIKGFNSYFNRVYLSSPMSKKKNKTEKFILRVNRKVYRKALNSKFIKLNEMLKTKNLDKYFLQIHADLHLNNIYVCRPDLEVKVLDWENSENSFMLFDLNYLFCFMMYLLDGLPKHQEHLYNEFDKLASEKFGDIKEPFFYAHDIFMTGISLNRDFGYKISFLRFLKELITFGSKLKKI